MEPQAGRLGQILDIEAPRPILKWAGGKQQLLRHLLPKVPNRFSRYIEPFVGGGALFFALRAKDAILSDSNPELINLYEVVANNLDAFLEQIASFKVDKDSFYEVRARATASMGPVERAARTYYLNKTCFNGLYRVNRSGQFNVPYGRYAKVNLCDVDGLRAASIRLKSARISCCDYLVTLGENARPGDFIFLDPPYIPISKNSDFKRYTQDQFRETDHVRLAEEVRRLRDLGCHVMLTNSNSPLVYDLYPDFDIEVVPTKRYINSVGSQRKGEDVIITATATTRRALFIATIPLSTQVAKYPTTRYMGSKQELLADIWRISSAFKPRSVLDLFCGSGVVSYMFKSQGLRVVANDYMALGATFAGALIQNSIETLTDDDVNILCSQRRCSTDGFVSKTFKGLYFDDEDNEFIDKVRARLTSMPEAKVPLVRAALIRACMKKRARGIFTYVGSRYDDGRPDMRLTLEEHFRAAAMLVNAAVFDNGHFNEALNEDALRVNVDADLVYIDPPYFSPHSDNEYVRRYHFVEGLARDWDGVEIQAHTKTKKFKGYPTPFSTLSGTEAALEGLFAKFRDRLLLVSYSSNALPSAETITSMMARYKNYVEVISVNHRYSFGNQGHLGEHERNAVREYLFVGA